MLKIFSTQLQGIFKKIEEKEESQIEEGARLLAQSIIGEGTVYIHGFHELKSIELTATIGPEPIKSSKPLFENGKMNTITSMDRVLIIARTSSDKEAIELAKQLANQGILTVAISSDVEDGELSNYVDIHINSYLTKGLIPDDEGNRYGLPTTIAGLFAYHGLSFTIAEIIAEYEE